MHAHQSLDGLFDALNQCREPDFVLLGVIADALEEAGDERAEGYRWAVEERRWPSKQPSMVRSLVPRGYDSYFWWIISEQAPLSMLPKEMWHKWMPASKCFGGCRTITAAFDDLCLMLHKTQRGTDARYLGLMDSIIKLKDHLK